MRTDPYGILEKPEERTPIKVAANPVRTALAAHALWLPLAYNRFRETDHMDPFVQPKIKEYLYREAASLLSPHAKHFGRMSSDDLELIMLNIDHGAPAYKDRNGYFLSALLNETDLPVMSGRFNYHEIGYKLAPGKLLIVQPGSRLRVIGFRAAGAVVNYGTTVNLALKAQGGVQINCG